MPHRRDRARAHIDHRDGALASIRGIQPPGVAAEVQPVSAAAGGKERENPERVAVDHVDAVARHVGDEEDAAVRRESHVLRHRMAGELQRPDHLLFEHVDLHELTRELAARDQVAAAGGEVHVVDAPAGHRDLLDERHRVRIAEIQTLLPLRHHNRVPPVRRVIHVVGIGDRHRLLPVSGHRIDARQTVAFIREHPQRLQVVGRGDVLRLTPDLEMIHDLVGGRVDDVDGPAATVRARTRARRRLERPRSAGPASRRRTRRGDRGAEASREGDVLLPAGAFRSTGPPGAFRLLGPCASVAVCSSATSTASPAPARARPGRTRGAPLADSHLIYRRPCLRPARH